MSGMAILYTFSTQQTVEPKQYCIKLIYFYCNIFKFAGRSLFFVDVPVEYSVYIFWICFSWINLCYIAVIIWIVRCSLLTADASRTKEIAMVYKLLFANICRDFTSLIPRLDSLFNNIEYDEEYDLIYTRANKNAIFSSYHILWTKLCNQQ